jgi:Na+/phosphate symporter
VFLVFFRIYRSHIAHKDRFGDDDDSELFTNISKENKTKLIDGLGLEIQKYLRNIPSILMDTIIAFDQEERIKLKEERKKAQKKKKKANNLTNEVIQSLSLFKIDEIKSGKRFGKIISSLQEIAIRTNNSVSSYHDHIENNHTVPTEIQIEELKLITGSLEEEIRAAIQIFETKNYSDLESYIIEHDKFQTRVNELDFNQISRIQSNADSNRNSLLYLNLLADLESISNHILRIMNAFKNITFDKKVEMIENKSSKDIEVIH